MRELAGDTADAMEGHCLRLKRIATALAAKEGVELDDEVLACAASLHDAGLYEGAASDDHPYVEDGAILARDVLAPFNWSEERLTLCADAIERHHELRSQWDRGAEVELVRRADIVDVSACLISHGYPRADYKRLVADVPREGMYGAIFGLVAHEISHHPVNMLKIFRR